MATNDHGVSPRIYALRRDLERGNAAALDEFWTNLTQSGTPLIEECDDDAYHLVTFVWHGDSQTRNVVLISDVFGNALAQSGAFWNGRQGEAEEEWLAPEIARRERVPVRFYLEAGRFENQRDVQTTTILRANRHLRTVLQAKGYDVHYTEFSGGHRVICWQGTLADGLVTLAKPTKSS